MSEVRASGVRAPGGSPRSGGRALALAAACLAASTLGASCDRDAEAPAAGGETASGSDPVAADRVDEVPGVDVAALTGAERGVWLDLVNDRLAPCGPATTVGRCAAGADACAQRCKAASGYLARLVAEGYEAGEIESLYQRRYDPDAVLEIDLEGAPVRGSPMAPVTVVEFSDFECPFCGRAHPVLERLEEELRGRVKIVFFHFPLRSHTYAESAARAAVAAQRQGKFWEMHDLLFANQTALEPSDIEGYAERIGLDMARFRADWDSEETRAKVAADRALGERVGVDATPTLLVDGRRFEEPVESLRAYVLESL